ncbi:uncharacterized protein N7484_000027 [Penicillium longicatenatum]|uniref:uncharacterized protein n=1 Tax=Penicillium longicatenatum TaxID=1561947 RepID=UPI0025479776|nr:uncharacterized protein N7484_000027 [Penicillium longicatenatum]KAJ5660655.1 hypothetical protein N7484_000027 [Penicillium longicatenatum]
MSSDIYTPPLATVPPPERPLTGPGSHSLATSLGPVSLPRPHKATMPPGLPPITLRQLVNGPAP